MAVPNNHGDPAELRKWTGEHLEVLREKLRLHGAILFRGFSFTGPKDFEDFITLFCPGLLNYIGGNSPRTKVSGKIYTSTEYSRHVKIIQHNEASNLRTIPRHIFFFCEIPSQKGGQTPLSDSREVFQKISPEVKNRFISKKIKYISHLNHGNGFGRSWQQQFESTDPNQVEQRLKTDGYEYTWKPDGGLRVALVCDAAKTHPETGEMTWVTQADLWHPSSLDPKAREAVRSLFKGEDLPHDVCFGDGSPIPEEDIRHIREIRESEEVEFNWERGDVLVCDNLLAAHGRNPFAGERRILVALG